MPKAVDHDARRRDIAGAFVRLAGREGIHAVTTRSLAAELGMANGSLWNYFDSSDAILAAAFQLVYENTNIRIHQSVGGLTGLTALRAMMREILPLTSETQTEAIVVVSFWGRIPASSEMVVHQKSVDNAWREQILHYLEQAKALHELRPEAPVTQIIDLLLLVSAGQQVEFVTGSDMSTPERTTDLLEHVLHPWLSPGAQNG